MSLYFFKLLIDKIKIFAQTTLLYSLLHQSVSANEQKSTPQPVPEKEKKSPQYSTDGISLKIVEMKSQNQNTNEMYFTFGVYKEKFFSKTKDLYAINSIGVLFSYTQRLRGIWSGSLEGRWSNWREKDPNNPNITPTQATKVSPLSLFSKITASPEKYFYFSSVGFSPYAAAGVGYTFFFQNRSPVLANAKTQVTEGALIYGFGMNIKITETFGLVAGLEQWTGLNSSDFNVGQALFGVRIGTL